VLDVLFATIGGLALALGLASRPLRDLPVTEPLAALLLGVVLGPAVLDLVAIGDAERDEILATTARIVMALSLMAAALRYPTHTVGRHVRPLVLLLVVVTPVMLLVSSGLAIVVLGMPVGVALVLGAAVAPTDPVLAASIVEGDKAERDLPLRLRLWLSIESGANDGLGAVLLLVGLAVVTTGSVGRGLGEAAVRLLIALPLGLVLGDAAGRLLTWAHRHHDIEHSAFLGITLSVTLFVLGVVSLAGGEGLVGVFVAGLTYNRQLSRRELAEEWEVQEAINRYLVLPAFTLLGVALPWSEWARLGGTGIAFTVGLLLLRRPIVLLLLRRPLKVDTCEALFLGWFGPVGAAAMLVLAEAGQRGVGAADAGAADLWAAGSLVIALSTVLHGVTAAPARRVLGRREAKTGADEGRRKM
jgi:sodium/hydrogen antiporter